MPDATANPDEWTAYRQALRDLPQTTEDPAAAGLARAAADTRGAVGAEVAANSGPGG